jgi:hypothetical protein
MSGGISSAMRAFATQRVLTGLAGHTVPGGARRDHAIRQAEIARLALALVQARCQLKDNRKQLLAIVDDIAPGLTKRYGVGPVSAAQAIVSFSHPGRCRSEAAFASLGGTSPIPASSGRTVRHRLNRGGDRALNRAIHAIAVTRIRSCARTAAAPGPQLRPDPRLRRPPHRRGKDPTRDPPLPQALHRPRALPPAHPLDESSRGPLTNIERQKVGGSSPSERASERAHDFPGQ